MTSKESTLSAQNQMAFQERMSSTAHQREVLDLQAAGLNPVLSSGGSGASTPSGAAGDTSTDQIVKLLGDSIQTTAKALNQANSNIQDLIWTSNSAKSGEADLTDFGKKLAGLIGNNLRYNRDGSVNMTGTVMQVLKSYSAGEFDDLPGMIGALIASMNSGSLAPVTNFLKSSHGSKSSYFNKKLKPWNHKDFALVNWLLKNHIINTSGHNSHGYVSSFYTPAKGSSTGKPLHDSYVGAGIARHTYL